jgi:hypothetical protein
MTTISKRRAAALLFPIAAFLHAGGMSDEIALRIFGAALKKVSKSNVGRKMEHIGQRSPYADTVEMWVRNKRFLDESGGPRPLSFNGPAGFAALVRSVDRKADPADVLSVLIRYGNVKRTRRGTYTLMRLFFYTSGSKTMAYEPVAEFLSDASSTLSKILRRSPRWRGPELFWLQTYNAGISERNAKRFIAHAKDRSLIFLEELDDWLEANSDKGTLSKRKRSRQPLRKVGLGIFPIHTNGETLHGGR